MRLVCLHNLAHRQQARFHRDPCIDSGFLALLEHQVEVERQAELVWVGELVVT
jgi:hypothetical protein